MRTAAMALVAMQVMASNATHAGFGAAYKARCVRALHLLLAACARCTFSCGCDLR